MSNHCFSFLNEDFSDISDECELCEKYYVEGNYNGSISSAGKACELITKKIAHLVGRDDLNEVGVFQDNRTRILLNTHKIPLNLETDFRKIRQSRNKAQHTEIKFDDDFAYQIHSRLFKICAWFYREYSNSNFNPPEYNGPIFKSDKLDKKDVESIVDNEVNGIKDILNKYDQRLNELESQNDSTKSQNSENDNLKDYNFQKDSNGSYLLNELSKLKISSAEAVENEDNLDDFKNYIHVSRPIHDEFIDELKKVVDKDSSHLVMLCGNVGDGKSHLLAYLKTHEPELYDKFTIHSDATESYFTNKSAEDTLSKVLSSFNDYNIDSSFEKFILAINLGVLNNFLESQYCDEKYDKLKQIIQDANIFDSDVISHNISGNHVSFITFSDYNLFELNNDYDEGYVSSNYIDSLFNKITDDDYYNNPFYRAYMMDVEEEFEHPAMFNYQLLSNKNVQDIILKYIIRIFIEYKKIISTRDLLNFIYELIVPPEFVKYDKSNSVSDIADYLLPNILFNSFEDSNSLLYLLSNYDPTLIRSEKIDDFIMKFNTVDELSEILNEYFKIDELKFLKEYFDEFEDLTDCGTSEKEKLIITLIRFAVFYGKSNFKRNFVNEDYLNYLKYLYNYNAQNHGEYQDLFNDVKKAIFNFRGSFHKNFVCIDELDSFKVSKELKLTYSPDKFDKSNDDNRFKTTIRVFFSVSQSNHKIPLEIDYSLYSTICKLNRGFKPNKSDKEDLILFDEFINNLINETSSSDLLIRNLDVNVDFTFEYNEDFNSFSFERGG